MGGDFLTRRHGGAERLGERRGERGKSLLSAPPRLRARFLARGGRRESFPMIGNFFSNGWKTFLTTKNTKPTKSPNPFVPFVSFVAETRFPNAWKTFPPPGGCGFQPRSLHYGAAGSRTPGSQAPPMQKPPPRFRRCGILPRHRARDGQGKQEESGHGCSGKDFARLRGPRLRGLSLFH